MLQAGKLEKHVKSEEPPKKNKGPVKIVTGSTFEEFVSAKGQNTLIEFYAPWCASTHAFEQAHPCMYACTCSRLHAYMNLHLFCPAHAQWG